MCVCVCVCVCVRACVRACVCEIYIHVVCYGCVTVSGCMYFITHRLLMTLTANTCVEQAK